MLSEIQTREDWNPSQQQALVLDCHVALTAAAGSGKTTVLVERFLRTLESNGFQPGQIVSITFTEEAAGEMRERIRSAVSARCQDFDSRSPDRPNLWRRAQGLLAAAKITTIHGFCLSLLREHPLEVGLDPSFHLPSPAEQEMLLLGSVAESLLEFSRSSDPDLSTLLGYLSTSSVESMLVEMLRRRNHLPGLDHSMDFEELLEVYREETCSILFRMSCWESLEALLRSIPPRLLQRDDSCARRCRAQAYLYADKKTLDSEAFLERFQQSLSTRAAPSRIWKESGYYESLKALWQEVREAIKKHPLKLNPPSTEEDEHYRRALQALYALYGKTLQRYQQSKRQKSILDFDDLLSFARLLIQDQDALSEIRRRYRYFLVDEFQDTNFVQWEILQPLIGRHSNLFVVGDSKQSIYRFRGAEVGVFKDVQKWVRDRGRLVEMPENYRSRPVIVQFCNRVFAHLFTGDLKFEAQHQEMRVCRPPKASEHPGRLDVFFHETLDNREPPVSEPEFTAAWIRRLIARDGYAGGDIAVLLRARTRLKEYETALRERGVEFLTIGGAGFFESQEVLDLMNLLEFLSDPLSDWALAGVLRSPLFSLADDELFFISVAPGNFFWEKFERGLKAAPEPPAHWRFAGRLLKRWISERDIFPVSVLLGKVLQETGYLEILAASSRGQQSILNVEKLTDLVRRFEKSEKRTVREVVRFLNAMRHAGSGEPEAALDSENGQAVRIYTIHGGKGLQFPVVVLPELGTPLTAGPSDRFLIETFRRGDVEKSYFGFKIWNPDRRFEELAHPMYSALRKLDLYRQTAEEKRLLYVAATRCCDHLILIGRRTPADSYSTWLEDSGANEFQISEQTVAEILGIAAAPPDQPQEAHDSTNPAWSLSPEQIPPAAAEIRKRRWTPTEIALFARCPRKLYLSRFEMWPEESSFESTLLGHDSSLIGSAVHEILETIPDLAPDAVEKHVLRWQARLQPARALQEALRLCDRLLDHLKRVRSSPFFERIQRARRSYAEKQFYVREGDRLITGVIDRLFQESDGRWIVVDFKTNSVSAPEMENKARSEGYDLQLELYLWAVSRVLSTEDLEGVLFFTHGGDLLKVSLDARVKQKCLEWIRRLPATIDLESFPLTSHPQMCRSCEYLKSGLCPGAAQPIQQSLW